MIFYKIKILMFKEKLLLINIKVMDFTVIYYIKIC